MNTTDKTDKTLSRIELTGDERADQTHTLFGLYFPLHLEPTVYAITDRIAPAYTGGFWRFWRLANGSFYMTPDDADAARYWISSMNGWQGKLSADALGIVSCLTAYSHLSFGGPAEFARECARHYHLLREYMFAHAEVAAILRAVD